MIRNLVSRLACVVVLLGVTVVALPAAPASATAYANVTLIADNTTRTVTKWFTDTSPYNEQCQDDNVYGALRFTYKASGTKFSITKTELYVSSTQANSAAISYAAFTSLRGVDEGVAYMAPEMVGPGRWGTLVVWNGSRWINSVMNGDFGRSQYSFSISKNDPNLGWDHYLCNGIVVGAFFKK